LHCEFGAIQGDDSNSVGDKRNFLTTSSNELAPAYGTVFTSGLHQVALPSLFATRWAFSQRSSSYGATSSNVGFEFDTYADWKINKNFTLSLVGAFANPEKAVQQAYNRTDTFSYGMVYIAYSF
jgi:hypothetical protein